MSDKGAKPLTVNPPPLTESVDDRLTRLGIVLPTPSAPVAAYVPTVQVGDMLYVSGQLPFADGRLIVGRLGDDVNLDLGREAARACALMLLAQMKAALGSLDRIERIVKLNIFVNSDARFTDQPKVGDGASTLMVDIFGEAGRHARAAVGVPALPLGAAVEVDATVLIRPA
jgi:enamine deaminase RidA (YjgF/YER057c/UK114 family)